MTANEDYIRKNKVVIVDDDKNTKLHYAAALDNKEELEKIILSGQKLDPENYLGWTPLMMAVRNGNVTAIKLLLDNGADATKKNKFGMNVFLITVTCGKFKIVEQMLEHLLTGGVSRRSLQQVISPISLAILFGHGHIFRYLLKRSFDPDVETPLTGITPMMFAAAMGNQKAMNRLLQYKANVTKRNYLGKTAADILQSRHQKIDIDNGGSKQKPPPLIIISPHTRNSPHFQLTPFPIPTPNGSQHIRKSSNTQTPQMLNSPAITPLTPHLMPQMFFGTEFTPTHFISPHVAYHSNSLLNATMTPSAFMSPVVPQPMCQVNGV